jgi:hypothetical protein
MMGKTVQNEGTIVATMGNVQMASGEKISLNLNGNSLVKLTIDEGTLNALVENKGLIQADGGQVYLTTQALNTILDGMVNNTGIIEANTLNDVTGEVILFAHGGTANISGSIIAEGGFIETSGKNLSVADGTIIKAKEWLIDPTNITIESSGSTTDLASSSIKASFIESTLNGGTGVTLTADNDINVNENLSWNQSLFTLNAGNNINVNAVMNATGTASLAMNYGVAGAINMGMNSDKTGFDGKIGLASTSNITLNGDSYTIISDRAGLVAINAGLSGKYVLASDIDLSGEEWITLGTFRGTLNALGHTIDGMTIVVTNGVGDRGLFYGVENGSVSNLALTNIDISGNGSNYGTLASWMYNASISNIILEGSVTGAASHGYFGGLTGWVGDTTIDNVHANVDVEGSRYVGGLVSYGENLTITNSSSKGIIKGGANYIGGLIGYHDQGTITDSYATGSVEGNYFTGGLIGYNDQGTITDSHATGNVEGNRYTGGLMGYNNGGTISGSYASGDVTSIGYYVGGLVGYNDADDSAALITDSYATGDVSGYWQVGGLVGFNWAEDVDAIISNSYATGAVSGERYIGGLVGANENYGSGNAVIENSYATGAVSGISQVGGLVGRNSFWGGLGIVKISNSYATGTVDGETKVGGLVGEGYLSRIETSYASGEVTGIEQIGGLIGNTYGDVIENVFATGDVTSTSAASAKTGALIGMFSGGSVTTSYASGLITVGADTSATLGGLIGDNFNNSTTVSDSFYNKTLNVGKSDEETLGKTTDELRLFGTFANWDIEVDSTLINMYPRFASNGSNTVWVINPAATGLAPVPEATPTATTNTVVQNQVNDIITTIVNSTTVTPPLPVVIAPFAPSMQQQGQTQALNNLLIQSIMPQGSNSGSSFNLVGTTEGANSIQIVSMEDLQKASGGEGVNEIRVPLGQDSFVELINGGVTLPTGVSQEFYVVASNEAPSSGGTTTTNKKAKK